MPFCSSLLASIMKVAVVQRAIDTLLIPPSSWERLLPLLNEAPSVKVEYGGKLTEFYISEATLPIRFHFNKKPETGHVLSIDGLNYVQVLEAYNLVLCDGQFFQLSSEDCKRLADLKRMIETSGTRQLPISNEQIGFFIEKVVPGLRRIGEVQLDESVYGPAREIPVESKAIHRSGEQPIACKPRIPI